ncbi:MAG: hypothetical protein IPJ40_08160 [Saprospirales bacterium]|nr:hypothetical protein [Saprospirales bacterium]
MPRRNGPAESGWSRQHHPAQVNNGSNDVCGIATLVLDQVGFNCDDIGLNTVTLTVTDVNGNSNTCTATITVEDNVAPEALCQNLTVELDAAGAGSITPAEVNNGSTDACGVASLALDQVDFDCTDVGPNVVTLTVTDVNGNSNTCTAAITVEDNVAPEALCQGVTVHLNLAGLGSITPAQVNNGSNDVCGIATLVLDQVGFNCDDIGLNTVTLTVTDVNGNSSTCTSTITVLASAACPVPDIHNYGGPNVSDPCTCLSDGKFAEEIVIGPTLPGMQWKVAQNNGLLNANTLLPFPAGTPFMEIPINMNESIYVLPGVHIDAIGYSLQAENPFYPNVTLTIGNTCYYPDPEIIGLGDLYCLNSDPVELTGEAGGVALISESFTIDGIPATFFDPMALGGGLHTVTYTVDAGTAGSFDPSDPGCVASVSQEVEVVSESPGVMVCNDLVLVSVDENCEAFIDGDMVLEGDYYCYDDFQVNIYYNINPIPNPIPSSYLGLTLNYTVVNLNTWNECSGQIILGDEWEPMIFCSTDPYVIGCNEDLSLIPEPLYGDNCGVANIELVSMTYLDTDACDDGMILVEQVWIATDASGNVSEPCTRLIEIHRTANDLIDFPNDITWECTQYNQYPNITNPEPLHPTILAMQQGTNLINATGLGLPGYLAQSGSGVPGGIQGTYCGYAFTHSDQITGLCGSSFQIIRTWTVLDECTGELITNNIFGEDNVQLIRVVDVTPPVVTVPPFTLSANIPGSAPGTCKSQGLLPPPTVTDNCNTWTYRIFTPIGEVTYLPNGWGAIPSPGLGLGFHTITYQVTDACGNMTTLGVQVQVVDDIAPTAICDEITDVNLTSDGQAVVNAMTFDDGSFDNCCLSGFTVRRLNGDCDGNPDDFDPTVVFCCEDVNNNPILVVLRVEDCFGNYNECQVEVIVNDKISPILLTCPPSTAISCEVYNATYMMPLSLGNESILDNFGTAEFYDNCLSTLNVDYTVTVSIDNCSKGVITRKWTASDDAGNGPLYCTQTIMVYHISDWVVEFPADVLVECTDGQLPPTGEPEIFFDDCELIATSYEDQTFTVVPDACYKIQRIWTVINWCIYDQYGSDVYSESGKSESNLNVDWDGDGDKDSRTFRDGWNSTGSPGQADGFITFKQIIKVIDEEAPEFVVPAINGCVTSDCAADILLPYPTVMDDCSLSFKVDITGDFGSFPNITGAVTIPDVEIGIYSVTYAVKDNCGNTAYQTISVEVQDCLKPTPLCDFGLVVDIMQTDMVEVFAIDLDEGSTDNCGNGDLLFSFSADISEVSIVFTCANLGG